MDKQEVNLKVLNKTSSPIQVFIKLHETTEGLIFVSPSKVKKKSLFRKVKLYMTLRLKVVGVSSPISEDYSSLPKLTFSGKVKSSTN